MAGAPTQTSPSTTSFAQNRDFIARATKRLHSFFKQMGSFSCVSLAHYKGIISPLDSGESRGMHMQQVMDRRWEMLRNAAMHTSKQYVALCVVYIEDLLHYGCLDADFDQQVTVYITVY